MTTMAALTSSAVATVTRRRVAQRNPRAASQLPKPLAPTEVAPAAIKAGALDTPPALTLDSQT